MRFDLFDWCDYRHPATERFVPVLKSVDFAERYDALCRRHPVRGRPTLKAEQRAALDLTGRHFYWHKLLGCWFHRERDDARLPDLCGIGFEVRIDARVELDLMFGTPDGHLGGPFPRLARQVHYLTTPDFKYTNPPNPAPRIGTIDELPIILNEAFELYDDLILAIKQHEWWPAMPKPPALEPAVAA